jgi:hypothetical protein
MVKIEITEIQAICLSQDKSTIVRDEFNNKIKYINQWYFYCNEEYQFVGCYDRRAIGGGTYYAPPSRFFLCDE